MRKQFLFILLALLGVNAFYAQTRGTKIGYIDMEYILQNVPNYTEAQNQLEQKAQKWKQDVEAKKNEINKLKDALKAEKALLTKGLIEERGLEITFLENENLEYQQKRFGPNGDLMIQKEALTKPIQDQVFSIVQDLAETKKYDFMFDKTSDMTMLFAAKRFDISDQIIRVLNRAEKREQLTKKQLKEEEAKEAKEDALADNPNLSERQKALETKKMARDAAIATKLLAQEDRKKAAEERKLQIVADREAKKNGTVSTITKTETTSDNLDKVTAAANAKQAQADLRAEALRIRQQAIEDKKKALEERKLQIIADREAKKSAINSTSVSEIVSEVEKSATKASTAATAAVEAKQKQAEARAKALEERNKGIEERKKALEEKRKQVLEAKESKKIGTVSDNTEKKSEKSKITETETVAKIETVKTEAEEAKQKIADAKAKTIEERNKGIEERKKALEDKRKKIVEDREAIKKANEEKLKTTKENTNNN